MAFQLTFYMFCNMKPTEDFNTTSFKKEGVSYVKPARKRAAESDVKQEICHENEARNLHGEPSVSLPRPLRNDRLSPVISEDPGSSTKSVASSYQSKRENSSSEFNQSKSVHTHNKSHAMNNQQKGHTTSGHTSDKGHAPPSRTYNDNPSEKSHTTPSHTYNGFSVNKSHTTPNHTTPSHTSNNSHLTNKHHAPSSFSSNNNHKTTGHNIPGKGHTTPNKCQKSDRNHGHANKDSHTTYNSYQPKNNIGSVDKGHVTTAHKNHDMDSRHQDIKSNTASNHKTTERTGIVCSD